MANGTGQTGTGSGGDGISADLTIRSFDPIINAFQSLAPLAAFSGRAFVSTFFGGIRSEKGSGGEAAEDVMESAAESLPHSDAKKGPLSKLRLLGTRTANASRDFLRRSRQETKTDKDYSMKQTLQMGDLFLRNAVVDSEPGGGQPGGDRKTISVESVNFDLESADINEEEIGRKLKAIAKSLINADSDIIASQENINKGI